MQMNNNPDERIATEAIDIANQELRKLYPDIDAQISEIDGNTDPLFPSFVWKCGKIQSSEFENLEDAFRDVCQYLNTPHLRILDQVCANTNSAQTLLRIGRTALSICHQYFETDSAEYIEKFSELFPQIDAEVLYDGEDDLMAADLTKEQRNAVEEAFCAIEYLMRKKNNLPIIPEDYEGVIKRSFKSPMAKLSGSQLRR